MRKKTVFLWLWVAVVVFAVSGSLAFAQVINNYPVDVQQKLQQKADLLSGGAFSFFFGPSSTNTDPTSTGCISGQALGTQPACTGPNVQVNNPNEDATFVGGTRVARFRGQSETTIAVSGSNRFVAWNDATGFFVPAKGLSGVGYSTDGGQTWCDAGGFFNPLFPTRVPFGDNSTAVDNNGNYFTAYLYDTPEVGLAPVSALGVTRVSAATIQSRGCPPNIGGESNIGDVPVIAAISGEDFLDKEWLAIDPNPDPITGKQDMYMCYTRFIGIEVGDGQIEVIRSLDGGQTWNGDLPAGAPGGPVIVQVDQVGLFTDTVNQGCYITVGENHQVYVVWENGWLANDAANDHPGNTPNIRFSKSTDFGVTFSMPKIIATFDSLARRPPAGFNRSRIDDFPKIAVDRSPFSNKRGSLYVTWQAAPLVRSPLADILVAISRDGGSTWQSPIVVNSDTPGADLHFMPSISVDDFGNANVIFYDRREDPFAPSPFTSSTTGSDPNDSGLTNLFAAQIPVIGAKIVNWKITDTKSSWRTARSNIAPNFGDYIHSVSVGSVLHSAWADSRNDNTPSPFYTSSDTKAISSTTK